VQVEPPAPSADGGVRTVSRAAYSALRASRGQSPPRLVAVSLANPSAHLDLAAHDLATVAVAVAVAGAEMLQKKHAVKRDTLINPDCTSQCCRMWSEDDAVLTKLNSFKRNTL
jgi:hypothetical protein